LTTSLAPEGTWAVIPAFNEAASLPAVIARAHAAGLRCVIVDDGSHDGTADSATRSGADLVVTHATNRGYAGALATGLRAAADQADCRWVVTLDADGQLDPSEAAAIVNESEAAGADVGIGIRPQHARSAERFAARVTSRLFGVLDPLCGLKAYRPRIIRRFSRACGRRVGMELAVRAAASGARIVQRPVSIRPSGRTGSRYGHGLWSEIRIVAATLTLVPAALPGARL
jgi:glycosyltransferase involved in cell wall biosynthesis